MKKKKILIAILFAAAITLSASPDGPPPDGGRGSGSGSQQVVVSNYYHVSGYEYATRISRFHASYVTFDFYSPMFTEIYWYRYTPYSWGVSIYDDWYYYSAGVSQQAWRSGYGGSYWWGYEPWRGYDRWMGYGWNSWYGTGMSYSVNYYLGRPHYHYPVAYNSWNNHQYRNYNSNVTVINNNTYNYYYGSEKRNSSQGGTSGYNPSNPNNSVRRAGYTSTGGRSSASGNTPAPAGSDGTQSGTQSRSQSGTRSSSQSGTRSQNQSGNQGQTQSGNEAGSQSSGDKEKNNNGLRMGQYRRGVAEPAEPGDNGLPRTNNPNVDDRTDPGKENDNATRGNRGQQTAPAQNNGKQPPRNTQGSYNQPGAPAQNNGKQQSGTSQGTTGQQVTSDRAPARTMPKSQVQTMVKTATQRRESAIRQGTPSGTSAQSDKSVKQGSTEKTEKSSEATSTVKETKKSTTTSQRKR